jgi:hypothetical protein
MKITIEPTEDQSRLSVDTMHSKVSISIARDDLDITDTMGQVVKALQAWGFHNESIAEELDYELAHALGLKKELSKETVMVMRMAVERADAAIKKDEAAMLKAVFLDPPLEQDITHEHEEE